MSAPDTFADGFEVPLHRSLTEPILLGGAPRTVAIANGTPGPATVDSRRGVLDRRPFFGGVGCAR